MSQVAAVKVLCERAVSAKVIGATQAEAKSTVLLWKLICDSEATPDLKSIATARRRELEGAVAREDATGREAALAALARIAAEYST